MSSDWKSNLKSELSGRCSNQLRATCQGDWFIFHQHKAKGCAESCLLNCVHLNDRGLEQQAAMEAISQVHDRTP